MVKDMIGQEKMRVGRTGFMKNVVVSQKVFNRQRDEIIQNIVDEASEFRREQIDKIYGSVENYKLVLQEVTSMAVDVQKGLVEIMMDNWGVDNEVQCVLLERMYGARNVCFDEELYWDNCDNERDEHDYYEDEEECEIDEFYDEDRDYEDDDDDEYYKDEEDEYEIDESCDEDTYYEDDDDEYEIDEYYDEDRDYEDDEDEDDEDEYYEEEDDYLDEERYGYENCLECYLFEDSLEYIMPEFQKRSKGVRQTLKRYGEDTEAEENKLCVDMGKVLDMPGWSYTDNIIEIPAQFSYEMKMEALAVSKDFELLPLETRTIEEKGNALINRIVRKTESGILDASLLDELIKKGSEYQLQQLFYQLEQ